jgi:hypothetical protein
LSGPYAMDTASWKTWVCIHIEPIASFNEAMIFGLLLASINRPVCCPLLSSLRKARSETTLCLLVNPVKLSWLPGLNLALVEPQLDFLLGTLDAVGAVADIATDILNG